jgi:hypothetical protein
MRSIAARRVQQSTLGVFTTTSCSTHVGARYVPTEAEIRAWAPQSLARPTVDILKLLLCGARTGATRSFEMCWSVEPRHPARRSAKTWCCFARS